LGILVPFAAKHRSKVVSHAIGECSLGRRSHRRNQIRKTGKAGKKKNNAAENHDKPADNVDEPQDSLLESMTTNPATAEEKHRSDEREFWQRQIRVGLALNWITGAGAAAAICGLIFLLIGLNDGRKALEETNRAWLAPVWGQLEFVDPNLIVKVKVVNFGKEPAIDMGKSDVNLRFVDISSKEAFEAIPWPNIDACKRITPEAHEIVVYPLPFESDENPTIPILIPKTQRDVAAHGEGLKDGTVGMIITGCIAYLTFGKVHHSQYCFLERSLPDHTIRATACDRGEYAD
jgi:hypothetical protein